MACLLGSASTVAACRCREASPRRTWPRDTLLAAGAPARRGCCPAELTLSFSNRRPLHTTRKREKGKTRCQLATDSWRRPSGSGTQRHRSQK